MSAKTPANRRTAWLIGALCLAPVLASYFAYYVAPPAGHTNAGDLLETRALPDPRLRLLDGTTFRLSQLHGNPSQPEYMSKHTLLVVQLQKSGK